MIRNDAGTTVAQRRADGTLSLQSSTSKSTTIAIEPLLVSIALVAACSIGALALRCAIRTGPRLDAKGPERTRNDHSQRRPPRTRKAAVEKYLDRDYITVIPTAWTGLPILGDPEWLKQGMQLSKGTRLGPPMDLGVATARSNRRPSVT